MRFNLVINEKELTACYTGKTARVYREQFKSDILSDISEASSKYFQKYAEAVKEGILDLENELVFTTLCVQAIGSEQLEKFTWACIYAQDQEHTPLYERWLDSVEDYQLMLVWAVICFQTMIGNNPIVEAEEKVETSDDEKKRQPLLQK